MLLLHDNHTLESQKKAIIQLLSLPSFPDLVHSQLMTTTVFFIYRKNSNITRTIFTTNRDLVVGVRIIHVN